MHFPGGPYHSAAESLLWKDNANKGCLSWKCTRDCVGGWVGLFPKKPHLGNKNRFPFSKRWRPRLLYIATLGRDFFGGCLDILYI